MTPDIKFASKTHPLIASLPAHLKDPAKYEEIQLKILKSFRTSCMHSEILQFAECSKCTDRMLERRKLLRELGFKNPAQYYAWQKIHQEIKKRYPLIDWKKENQLRAIAKFK